MTDPLTGYRGNDPWPHGAAFSDDRPLTLGESTDLAALTKIAAVLDEAIARIDGITPRIACMPRVEDASTVLAVLMETKRNVEISADRILAGECGDEYDP